MPEVQEVVNQDGEITQEVVRVKTPVGQVAKIGNLADDCELHYNDKGLAWTRARIGVNRPVVEGDWKGPKETDWYDVICFGSLAEHVAASLTKGTRVIASGRGEIEQYTDENGEPRIRRSILADGCGPDLRWATANVSKVKFEGANTRQLQPEPLEIPF